ncbi:MAG: Na(+)-translocating NADH-quinone reductase subunit A [Fuerstiella sp.]|nr:Na(+)-translocating NADH-quinone reductase subunit A [Fuerstiella sp.]
MHRITKGLDLPITGQPPQTISAGPSVTRVALLGPDYIGMKPTMLVQPGDTVKRGQPLFTDKKTEGVVFTSPAAGQISEVNRGNRRVFQSIVIDVNGDEAIEFPTLAKKEFPAVDRNELVDVLVSSGLWTSFRTRPYSRVPGPATQPRSIFVQAIDTNPLAADPQLVIREREHDFRIGLLALSRLTEGPVYVCRPPAQTLPGEDAARIQPEEFDGKHPAGLPGTHIHLLDPVGPSKTVWTINYQDVIAIGHLMTTGQLLVDRVISVAGPSVENPQLVRSRIGASLDELFEGRLAAGNHRCISGSVLGGRASSGVFGYLGRYHLQVTAIAEGDQREFLGWLTPGTNRFSVRRIFASALDRTRRFAFSTSQEGNERAMVPIGMYEQVMPLDILPTFLLRSLIVGNTEEAQALGCLELDEEDLALCTFVCPGKYEYGPMLRESLTTIEREG